MEAKDITLDQIIKTAAADTRERRAMGQTMTASYFMNCDCGAAECTTKWVVTVEPATQIIHNMTGRRSKQ